MKEVASVSCYYPGGVAIRTSEGKGLNRVSIVAVHDVDDEGREGVSAGEGDLEGDDKGGVLGESTKRIGGPNLRTGGLC